MIFQTESKLDALIPSHGTQTFLFILNCSNIGSKYYTEMKIFEICKFYDVTIDFYEFYDVLCF